MITVERIENAIRWDLPVAEQLDAMTQFDSITDAEIEQLFTGHKSSEVGYLLEYLGPHRLRKFLPQFLQFLQDMNWPAARGAAKMLVAAGEMVVPEIKRVFREENDSIWNDWIILAVLRYWNTELLANLKPDLLNLIQNPDKEGAATSALKILAEKGLLNIEEKNQLYQHLRVAYSAMHDNWGNDWWPNHQASLLADLDEVMQ